MRLGGHLAPLFDQEVEDVDLGPALRCHEGMDGDACASLQLEAGLLTREQLCRLGNGDAHGGSSSGSSLFDPTTNGHRRNRHPGEEFCSGQEEVADLAVELARRLEI